METRVISPELILPRTVWGVNRSVFTGATHGAQQYPIKANQGQSCLKGSHYIWRKTDEVYKDFLIYQLYTTETKLGVP